MNKKGFTLIELIVVVALLGIITMLTSNMLIFSNKSFESTTDQQTIQSDARLVSTSIENELKYATSIKILSSYPGSDYDVSKRYLYSVGDEIKVEDSSGVTKKIQNAFDFIDFDLSFSKETPTVLNYKLVGKNDGREFTIDSSIEILNLKGIKASDQINDAFATEGTCWIVNTFLDNFLKV